MLSVFKTYQMSKPGHAKLCIVPGAQPGSLLKRLKPYRRQGLVKITAVSGTS